MRGSELIFDNSRLVPAAMATLACFAANVQPAISHGTEPHEQQPSLPVNSPAPATLGFSAHNINARLEAGGIAQNSYDSFAAPVAAGEPPFAPHEETRSLTMEDVKKFLPVALSKLPADSPCREPRKTLEPREPRENHKPAEPLVTSESPQPLELSEPSETNTKGYVVNLKSAKEMTGVYEPGAAPRVTHGRYNGNCTIDLLNYTQVGSIGDNTSCTALAHEFTHSYYVPGWDERDPTGVDKLHNFKDPNHLMYGKFIIRNYGPCNILTGYDPNQRSTAESPPIPHALTSRDHIQQTAGALAEEAAELVPRLKQDKANGKEIFCEKYHRSLKESILSRFLCYSYLEPNMEKPLNGGIITIKSLYTKNNLPQYKSDKIDTKVMHRYLKYGPLSNKESKREYIRSKKASATINTSLRYR